jgi:DDE_Tnp_1-associated
MEGRAMPTVRLSLLELLATSPDPRSAQGKVHPLSAILGLVAVAILAGCQGLEAIAQFGRDHGPPLAWALGFRRGKTPAKSTFSEVLRIVNPQAVEAAVRAWATGGGRGGRRGGPGRQGSPR